MSATDVCRRWTLQVARLKCEVAKLQRRPASVESAAVLVEAVGVCESLLHELAGGQLQCEAAHRRVESRVTLWNHLYESMPIACLETDRSGVIVRANRRAGLLLNTSTRYLQDRLLMHFIEDRQAFVALLQRVLMEQHEVMSPLTLRPRERARVEIDVTAMPQDPSGVTTTLWFLVPTARNRQFPAGRREQIKLAG